MLRGHFPQARKQLKEAIECAETDDRYVNSSNSSYLANTHLKLGEIQKAQLIFTEKNKWWVGRFILFLVFMKPINPVIWNTSSAHIF
jgi:hypothetical protein